MTYVLFVILEFAVELVQCLSTPTRQLRTQLHGLRNDTRQIYRKTISQAWNPMKDQRQQFDTAPMVWAITCPTATIHSCTPYSLLVSSHLSLTYLTEKDTLRTFCRTRQQELSSAGVPRAKKKERGQSSVQPALSFSPKFQERLYPQIEIIKGTTRSVEG